MCFVRLSQTNSDPDRLRTVVGRIIEFRDGSMQYLMYKDWRGYESLALEVITAIENNLDWKPLLHRVLVLSGNSVWPREDAGRAGGQLSVFRRGARGLNPRTAVKSHNCHKVLVCR